MKSALVAFAGGLVFGLGLLASGMTDPSKVQGFLDVAGHWNPSLAFVMGGAIAVGLFAFAMAKRRAAASQRAWSGAAIELPTATAIDSRLIGGGVLFGIGWGLAGFCPGPVLVAAASGLAPALWFVPAMLVGMLAHDRLFSPASPRP
jgi:uncharacterized membrane protein YedE/YeeE